MFSWVSNKFYHVHHICEQYVIYPHSFGHGDFGTIVTEVTLGNNDDKRNRSLWMLFKFKNLSNIET